MLSVVAFAITAILAFSTFTSDRAFRRLTEQDLAILDSLGTIVHLDEVLTMSARMAAVTGEARWIDRYAEAEPELATAIEVALDLAPNARETEFLRRTDDANRRLVALETQCLDAARAGDLPGARERVFGPEYETLKREYIGGAIEARRICERRIAAGLTEHRRAVLASGVLAIGTALVGFVLLGWSVRWALRRHHTRHEMLVAMRRSTMGQLAAAMAHELNQPLAAIVNYCAAARNLIGRADQTERLRDAVTRSEQQAARAGRILERVMAFVRREEAPGAVADLGEVARDALDLVGVEARQAGVAVHAGDFPEARVAADPVEVQQVLVNLLVNAIDASRAAPGGGRVEVSASLQNGMAAVDVRDNGPGVPVALRRRLFQAFFTSKPDGLGLGLNISRGIVERCGGRLRYERDAAGTVFRFTLPTHV
ncbi:MAG: ATP-binding protein [Phycisphaerales bacterium]